MGSWWIFSSCTWIHVSWLGVRWNEYLEPKFMKALDCLNKEQGRNGTLTSVLIILQVIDCLCGCSEADIWITNNVARMIPKHLQAESCFPKQPLSLDDWNRNLPLIQQIVLEEGVVDVKRQNQVISKTTITVESC